MSEAYLGEIRLFPYGYPPRGWHPCDGSVFSIGANTALFALIGFTYGGNGSTTFAVPDLRGRTPVGAASPKSGGAYMLGDTGGVENVTLTAAEMPAHGHAFQVSSQPGTASGAVNAVYAQVTQPMPADLYGPMSNPPVAIDPSSVVPEGLSIPHENRQPFLVMEYCIATAGVFPART